MSRCFLIVIFWGVAFNVFAQQVAPRWIHLNSPVNTTLKNLIFVDSLNGWAAGDSGMIIHTSDGGSRWLVQNSTVQTFITDIFFVDENLGWALTLQDVFPFNTVILKTTNGGNVWTTEIYPVNNLYMRTIFFLDSLNGFMGGTGIAITSDGGNVWTNATIDSNMISALPVYNFNFYNRQFGYACGGKVDLAGVVWRTTDYGLNWSAVSVSADQFFDLYVLDSLNALGLSGDPEGLFGLVKIWTENAGASWNFEELPFYGLSFAIDFRTYLEGWSASGYKFLFTSDRGSTWIEKETPDSTVIYDLQFVNSQTGCAVGQDGVILKFIPPPVSVEGDKSKVPTEFTLYQNYPNPFNPITTIQYAIASTQFVSLKVYDVLGKEISNLVNEEKDPGIYKLEFDGTSINNGIYFYQLSATFFTETKKMILLK